MLIALTGIVFCCHCCALVLPHADSDNRDIVEASRVETVQQEPLLFNQEGAHKAGNTEVVLNMFHALWGGPGKVDGLHSLGLHRDGSRRGGNWTGEETWFYVCSIQTPDISTSINSRWKCIQHIYIVHMPCTGVSCVMLLWLTGCVANTWTVSLKRATLGDHQRTVKHPRRQVHKQCVYNRAVQLTSCPPAVSVQQDRVRVHLAGRRCPAHWQVSRASDDCDDRDCCRLCRKQQPDTFSLSSWK